MWLCHGNKAAQGNMPGKANINFEFRPEDNRYLIVHECSGLEPGDAQGLQAIRDFISSRTDASRSSPERLHAVWICIPLSDAIDGRVGEEVKEILGMRNVPVIVVFTKFDMAVSQVLFNTRGDDSQRHESARAKAYAMYEDICRSLFGKDPGDVPTTIASVKPRFHNLIGELIVMADRSVTDSRTVPVPSVRSGAHRAKPRIDPVHLAWSAALRASYDITIQASIEIGRYREWAHLADHKES
ncbi:hypothetical protein B0F90DRAFT_1761003 [Multifurca ochricompacta]|uniref:G domain-containing protein n=1 Tax=Multifurca ochricompacta TaxID=376703 RepID=A0AAD4LZ88_9AGAM|nr:hypothetical protein B0F90DRAFT_1761003 [Multifurca ochricompacta]